jgi:hypothetical protein
MAQNAYIHLRPGNIPGLTPEPPRYLIVPADTQFQYAAGWCVTRTVLITEFADLGDNLPEWLSVTDVHGTQHIFRSDDIIAVTIN